MWAHLSHTPELLFVLAIKNSGQTSGVDVCRIVDKCAELMTTDGTRKYDGEGSRHDIDKVLPGSCGVPPSCLGASSSRHAGGNECFA